MNLITCPVYKNTQKSGNQLAIINGIFQLNYSLLNAQIEQTVDKLKILGTRKYQRIGVLGENGIELIIILLALWRIGAVSCLLSTRLPIESLNNILQTCHCKFVLTTKLSIFNSRKTNIPILNIRNLINTKNTTTHISKTIPKVNLKQNATIIFTSGTTQKPKAVLHTYENHYFNALGSNRNISVKPGDRWLLSLPLYHVGGIGILFRILLGRGTLVVLKNQKQIINTIKQKQITHISLVPTQLYRLLINKRNHLYLKKMKAILLGGGPIPNNLLKKSVDLSLPVYITYGLTEMASQVATSQQIRNYQKKYKVKILQHRKVKILENKKILVKGKTLLKGYIENQKLKKPFDKNGWFNTGDIGATTSGGVLRSLCSRRYNVYFRRRKTSIRKK